MPEGEPKHEPINMDQFLPSEADQQEVLQAALARQKETIGDFTEPAKPVEVVTKPLVDTQVSTESHEPKALGLSELSAESPRQLPTQETVASTPTSPEAAEPKVEKKETATLNFFEVKAMIADRLGNAAKIVSLEIIPSPQGARISAELNAGFKGGKVNIEGLIVNTVADISVQNLQIDARFYVKSLIESKLGGLSKSIKEFLKTKYGKSISSLQITNEGLVITFESLPTPNQPDVATEDFTSISVEEVPPLASKEPESTPRWGSPLSVIPGSEVVDPEIKKAQERYSRNKPVASSAETIPGSTSDAQFSEVGPEAEEQTPVGGSSPSEQPPIDKEKAKWFNSFKLPKIPSLKNVPVGKIAAGLAVGAVLVGGHKEVGKVLNMRPFGNDKEISKEVPLPEKPTKNYEDISKRQPDYKTGKVSPPVFKSPTNKESQINQDWYSDRLPKQMAPKVEQPKAEADIEVDTAAWDKEAGWSEIKIGPPGKEHISHWKEMGQSDLPRGFKPNADLGLEVLDADGDKAAETYNIVDDYRHSVIQISREPGERAADFKDRAMDIYERSTAQANEIGRVVKAIKDWPTGDRLRVITGLDLEYQDGSLTAEAKVIAAQVVNRLGNQAPRYLNDKSLGFYIKNHSAEINPDQVNKLYLQGLDLYKNGIKNIDYTVVSKWQNNKSWRVASGKLESNLKSPITGRPVVVGFRGTSFDDAAVGEATQRTIDYHNALTRAQTDLVRTYESTRFNTSLLKPGTIEKIMALPATSTLIDWQSQFGGSFKDATVARLYEDINARLGGVLGTGSGTVGENFERLLTPVVIGEVKVAPLEGRRISRSTNSKATEQREQVRDSVAVGKKVISLKDKIDNALLITDKIASELRRAVASGAKQSVIDDLTRQLQKQNDLLDSIRTTIEKDR